MAYSSIIWYAFGNIGFTTHRKLLKLLNYFSGAILFEVEVKRLW
jgi:hypothetical protein